MNHIAAGLLVLLASAAPTAASAGGGGCHDGVPALETATTTVTIDHACFGPTAAKVAVGATVTWTNGSGLGHNISGPAIEFTDMPDGATFTKTFGKAGLYPYACTLHPGMSGVVVVGAAAPAAVAPAAPAVSPVASTTTGKGSLAPWLAGGAAVALVAGLVLAGFARHEQGVPLPAR